MDTRCIIVAYKIEIKKIKPKGEKTKKRRNM